MGQGQSSGEDTSPQPLKTDYYELLGVDRQATDEEIKRAYRRKALELHPDRNYGNVEQATTLFAEVQSAYEVLSDSQERAWYDSHKDILLRGESAAPSGGQEFSYNVRMTTAEEVTKLMLKFNGRLDYSNSPNGFYGGLQDFFLKLAKEEQIAGQWEGEESRDYPLFGHKDDDYENVVRPFYAAWNGFATKKSYAWKDQYRLSDAPDRRIRRLMEKENKKIRDDCIHEYNDSVRSLVAFVRKRDPRWQENQKSEAERQKILRDAAAAQAQRSRAARQARLQELDEAAVPEWAQSRTKDQHEGRFSSESEAEEHQYECVVCDKIFKSEAQLDAHEKSKKHLKLLNQLKREMRDEAHDLDGSEHSRSPEQMDSHKGAHAEDEPEDGVDVVDPGPAKRDGEDLPPPGLASESTATRDGLSSDPSDDDYASRLDIEDRLTQDSSNLSSKLAASTLSSTPVASDSEGGSQRPKPGKAKQRRAKKAAAAAQQPSDARDQQKPDTEFRCVVCQSGFPSKTQLFNHINKQGHAAPVSQVKTIGGKGVKGKKR